MLKDNLVSYGLVCNKFLAAMDEPDVLRKASVISQGLAKKSKSLEDKVREAHKGPEPKDIYFFLRIFLIITGLTQGLPGHFFITANEYWMYKFRNTTLDTVDSKHRTSLQAYFASWTSIASTVPSVICVMISTFCGHKIKTRSRLLGTISIILGCFSVFTVFIKVNTDTSMGTFFHASLMSLISKFPQKFVQWYLYGDGVSSFVSSILQIVSLSLASSTQVSALIYFLVGTVMMAITFFLIFVSKYFPIVRYHLHNAREDTKKPVHNTSDVVAMLKQIMPCLMLLAILSFSASTTHPSITNLIVSEDVGNGHPWADKYFVPVVSFLFASICSVIGRIAARSFRMKRSTAKFWALVVIIRVTISVPSVMLCNALPRHHLPVVFGHDWEYILITACLGFTGGALYNSVFLSLQEYAVGNEELAYLSTITFMTVYHALISPISLVFVKLL